MSQRKGAANSKFGHLFGDTSDSSTGSSKSSRLSISGDLYKDPLAAFNPPVSVPTTTTRGGAAAVKATLSSPPVSSSAAAAAAAAAGSKTPPGSGSNSRSSSRLQHHTLFSSLTGDTGGSLFDSAPQSASLTLSAAKRDLLFGDSGGPTSSSSASRKTSTAISRNSASSSRVPSPPLGVRVSTTTLNPDASPLGESTSNTNNKDEDTQSIKSPLSTQPLTRTNSQASTISHESVKSSRSVQSQEITDDARSIASSTRPIIPSKTASVVSSSVAPPASAPPLSSKPSTSTRPAAIKRASVDQPSKQSNPTAPTIVDPIFNPLDRRSPSPPSSEPQSPRVSKERIHHSASSTTSSQSIETFQSISRTSSPNIAAPPLSKNGFERDAENASPALGSRSSRPEAMNLAIPDDAAEAFANDLMFTSGPTSPPISSTLGHRSTSFLDSGIASSRSQHQPSIADALGNSNPLRSTVTTSVPGLGAGTVNHPRTGSGFSLGEDVVDSSNPWMNSLADSLQETKLRMVEGGGSKAMMDYTQSDDMSGPMFAQEDAFTLPSTSALSRSSLNSSTGHRNNTTHSTGTTTTNGSIGGHYPSSFVTPIPRLEEEMGGFDDVFSSSRSKSNSSSAGAAMATPTLALSTNWNIRDAVEAAALDPDFQGPRSIVNQSREKVLAIMQMPKDPLEKDAADQEAFDNPWE